MNEKLSPPFSQHKEPWVKVPPWALIALQDVGVTEIAGPESNDRVVQMHSHTKLNAHDDETAWCAAAVCCWLEESGYDSPKSARAKDFLLWGKEVLKPELGCVMVFKRIVSPGVEAGHVGLYMGETYDQYWLLGGNQSNQVKYQLYPKSLFLSARLPEVWSCP